MSDEPTSRRLIGVQPYIADASDETHAAIRRMLASDMREFIQAPTHARLRCVASLLLTYQDSFLLGRRRKAR